MKKQRHPLEKIMDERIAIIDGAMGTTIRTYGMTEADIRALLLDENSPDLEALHNLIMMC